MKIYVASSWRNPWQPGVVKLLRGSGHDVYDFREPEPGVRGFAWSEIDPNWKQWKPKRYREALLHPAPMDGFRRDFEAMMWCDACVLVLPCGNSAHLELGWCAGARKRTAILFPVDIPLPCVAEGFAEFGHSLHPSATCGSCGDLDGCHVPGKLYRIEPELMSKCADAILVNAQDLLDWIDIGGTRS